MLAELQFKKKPEFEKYTLVIVDDIHDLDQFDIKDTDLEYIKQQLDDKTLSLFTATKLDRHLAVVVTDKKLDANKQCEKLRRIGFEVNQSVNKLKATTISVLGFTASQYVLAAAEGVAMSNYQFLKYFTKASEKQNSLERIKVYGASLDKNELEQLQIVVEGNFIARDLVNEPLSYLTAEQLSEEIEKLSKQAGFQLEVLNKKKIESLKMGGLLAVNRGAPNPPTFNILSYKSAEAKNKKPLMLVGKGVVYDTGGLSLKPTLNSMDFMKSDMAGAAAVVGAIYAIAKAKLPIHVIGLIPATENRPDGNAYAPGDVVEMYNRMTVEVLNTDAEGRMILADALAYGQQYEPELCIDLATLTGAASMAVSDQATVAMGTANAEQFQMLSMAGFRVQERIWQFPFFDEYKDYLKSDIADMKNIGGPNAGSITAGKFLEYFTLDKKGKQVYPWIHLDIAGPAYLKQTDAYRGKNASGVGVRLLFEFARISVS